MSSKEISEVKQINVFLNDGEKLECSPRTQAILIGSDAEIVWVKFKNALEKCNDAAVQINRSRKTYSMVKKWEAAALKNPTISNLLESLEGLGFTKS